MPRAEQIALAKSSVKDLEDRVSDAVYNNNELDELDADVAHYILTRPDVIDSFLYPVIIHKISPRKSSMHSKYLQHGKKMRDEYRTGYSAYTKACKIFEQTGKRDKKLESRFITSPNYTGIYAAFTLKQPWPEAEKYIMTQAEPSVMYADQVLKRRWPEAEPVIMQDPMYAFRYAKDVIHDRWPEAEKYIKLDSKVWDTYCDHLNVNQVDEDWKQVAAAGILGAASLGSHANNIPTGFQQTANQKELSSTITGTPNEVILKRAAKKAGIIGHELAAFLSQCAHETQDFKHMKEFGGKLDFKKYDIRFNPNKAKALGNLAPGDGAKYSGRGYIQLTGRANYKLAGEALSLPLEQHPELVENPEIAAKVAVWYWKTRVQPKVKNFRDTEGVTKHINPNLRDLDKRKEKFKTFQLASL